MGLEGPSDISSTLLGPNRSAFVETHAVEVIDSRERSCEDLPAGCELPPDEAAEAMSENRRYAQWFFMTPREPWA